MSLKVSSPVKAATLPVSSSVFNISNRLGNRMASMLPTSSSTVRNAMRLPFLVAVIFFAVTRPRIVIVSFSCKGGVSPSAGLAAAAISLVLTAFMALAVSLYRSSGWPVK